MVLIRARPELPLLACLPSHFRVIHNFCATRDRAIEAHKGTSSKTWEVDIKEFTNLQKNNGQTNSLPMPTQHKVDKHQPGT